ncbi:hypothetical protein ACOSP7_012490 [Xanthoceras sorbifolium]
MVERKFAADSMSNIKPKIEDADKAVARRKARAVAAAEKKSKMLLGQQNVADMLKSGQSSTPVPTSPQVTPATKSTSKPLKKK